MHKIRIDKASVAASDWNNWRWQLRNQIEGLEGLTELLTAHGRPFDLQTLTQVTQRYRFNAVPYVLDLINWQDPNDPILRQCLPDTQELMNDPAGVADPYSERTQTGIPGLLHRFPDRALIVMTTLCAMACRHCTRKNTLKMPEMQTQRQTLTAAVNYITAHPVIREVILSGGEPLLMETAGLDAILGSLLAIPHVEAVRIGSRAPSVLPMRIDAALVDMLRRHRPLWFNTHFNHPRELTPEAIAACERLVDAGIPVSNQTVLLKGINDSLEVMRELCCALQHCRVRPYYVFLCDPIAGIAHFRVERAVAVALEEELRKSVGGLCVPRFVEDVPGITGKVPITL